jgi:dTDP-4-dehydrorhamnose 3,5-epimerase
VDVAELAIPGSYLITPHLPGRRQGAATEWYRHESLAGATGHAPALEQAVCLTSPRGVVHGIHWVDVPGGQSRYVTCVNGAVLYVVVDLRVGSLTFGEHAAIELDAARARAVFAGEGLGHGFVTLTDGATVISLRSSAHDPATERTLDPLDPRLGLPWSNEDGDAPAVAAKDAGAPGLVDVLSAGLLPSLEDCRELAAARRAAALI